MKKILNILFVLSLCFLGKAQAQENQSWTAKEVMQAATGEALKQADIELAYINAVSELTESQKGFLLPAVLYKNKTFEGSLSARQKHWNVSQFLISLEDVIRYGGPIDRNLVSEDMEEIKSLMSEELFEELFLNNEKLMKELNLVVIED